MENFVLHELICKTYTIIVSAFNYFLYKYHIIHFKKEQDMFNF